ncbi:IS3 family transposase [Aggregatibacter actinomycetemcomitans]|uniref:IS3 family transposase n=1 Tax=Aggregatibacter actinomycetemcomitans TaxID=714 RepID=UPI001F121C46|nr:IS3 family transposase [Aggregatibacter actinomycetemcomitans]MBN6068760.1 IS3 family transposase [Aggregatibacter actinomycetemcomitans]
MSSNKSGVVLTFIVQPLCKTENLYRENYAAKTAALLGITEYIEDFYNPKQLHSALGNLSPMMFEAKQQCLTL